MNKARTARLRSAVPGVVVCSGAILAVAALPDVVSAQPLPAYGVTGAHDPSTLEPDGSSFIYFCTGQGIVSRISGDMEHWTNGPVVFNTIPAWTQTAVPGFTGDFWAPDVSYFDGLYHLYYAVSTFGSQVSAIGMATNTTMNTLDFANYKWADQGSVIQSTTGSAYNTIDPSVLVDTNGSVWMSFGSYWNGIYLTQLNPSTGKPINSNNVTHLAYNSQIEASYLYHQGDYYYLFVNFGMCCMGVNSTYNIRVGRATSVNGPYYDENGVAMTQSGGTLLLGSEGRYIGPGQIGIMPQGNVNWMSYHYYDGNNNGAPTYALQQLYWNNQSWPTLTTPTAEALTWNNTAGKGDGATWDFADNENWNAGSPSTYLDGDAVTFNDTNNGHYAVTLNSTVNPGSIAVNNSAGNYVISGTGSIAGTAALSKSGSSNLTLNTVNTYTGGTTVSAGTLIAAVPGALPNGALTITGGTVQLASSTGLTQLTSLAISGSGTFDVNNNHVIINYGSGPDPIASIATLLKTGFDGGVWTGAGGIMSSAAAANPAYALGYADSADPGNPAGLASGTIEIKFTLLGDANLDGVVNGIDFGILAANFNKGASAWDQGDFFYHGVVNGVDFAALAGNFNQGATGTSIGQPAYDDPAILAFAAANGLLADVPEPTSGLMVTMGAAVTLARRRYRRNG